MLGTCISIFLARVVDVSLGTIRTVYTVKGKQYLAALIAFFEVFVWFLVAREALNTDITSIWVPISYSAGYATGTLLGIVISNNLVSGLICVQIITKKDDKKLIDAIRNKGYGLSIVALKNEADDVKKEMFFIEINKKSLKHLVNLVKKHDKSAFIMVNETKIVHNGLIK